MENSIKSTDAIKTIETVLNEKQQQLLKDTIIYGAWGDSEIHFEDGDNYGYGYCTNESYKGGHLKGREISANFSAIFKKLYKAGAGKWFVNAPDWWGDGTGDMIFIKYDICDDIEKWARQ